MMVWLMRIRFGAVVATILAFAVGSPAEASFLPPASYAVGASASAIAYGDFTGDGIPDIAVARPADNDVVIFPGRANGTFGPPLPPIAVGQDPVAVSSCVPANYYRQGSLSGPISPDPDFDLNSDCDLVVADAGSDDIAVLLNEGDGSFASPIFIPVDGTPGALTVTSNPAPWTIVFTEPDLNRIGVIAVTAAQPAESGSPAQPASFAAPTYTPVGNDPVAVTSAPTVTPFPSSPGGPVVAEIDWPVWVADAGSKSVDEFSVGNGPSGQPSLYPYGGWSLPSAPTALTAGSFGVAVAEGDSGDVQLLGIDPDDQSQYGQESPPIPVGQDPIAIGTMTDAGGTPYGDLAVLDQDGKVTILQQTSSPSGSWPTFTSTTLSAPGSPTMLLADPLRPLLDPRIETTASQQVTDLALLDPSGTFTVLLQNTPRLVLEPKTIDFNTPAGGSSTEAVSVDNDGYDNAHIASLAFDTSPFFAAPFSLVSDRCSGGTLAPGQTCTAAVRFAPSGPGSWSWGFYGYTGTGAASAFGAAEIDATAFLQASVSPPPDQSLAGVLTHGLRAGARCSATCSLTIRVILQTRHSANKGRLVGIAHTRSKRGHRVIVHIPIRGSRLAHLNRVHVILLSTASATGYTNNGTTSVRLALKPVRVLLTSHPHR